MSGEMIFELMRTLSLIGATQPSPAKRRKPPPRHPEVVAQELLDRHLSPKQRRQLQMQGYFDVIGSKTGRSYRIHACKYLGNVWDIKGGYKYCAYAAGKKLLPVGDHLLAQKLLIETDEARFLAVANRASISPPPW